MAADYSLLQKIGLSRAATVCYECLIRQGSASAQEISERLSLPRTNLYRVLKHLEEIGFVTRVKSDSQLTYFYPVWLDKALENYGKYQQLTIGPLLEEQREKLRELRR